MFTTHQSKHSLSFAFPNAEIVSKILRLILFELCLFHPKSSNTSAIAPGITNVVPLVSSAMVRFLASAAKFTSAYTLKAIFLHSPYKELADVGAKTQPLYEFTKSYLWKMRIRIISSTSSKGGTGGFLV